MYAGGELVTPGAFIEMALFKKCMRCKQPFDPRDSKYLCGYGKCSKCCGECMHRNYPNPDYNPEKSATASINRANAKVLGAFFGKL